MRSHIKSAANFILKPVGLRITTVESDRRLNASHVDLVGEMHMCLTELLFPHLPPRPRRVQLMAKLLGTHVSEATYIVSFLNTSLSLPGDVCEFGVAQGATSALLANEIADSEKNLWLFDSFEGLPNPTKKDILLDDIFGLGSMEKYAGTMSCPVELVESRLGEIGFPGSRTRVVKGFIEESLSRCELPGRVCFAYVDLDLYGPTALALDFLHKHLSVGGHVVVDDFGYFSQGARTAVDEFTQAHLLDYELILPHAFAGHFAILHRTA